MSSTERVDAVVIGAGFAGMYMVYRLREAGFRVQGLEAGDDVGGTWYWNRYPGARCDSETMWYSYSFLGDVEQQWPMTERFPSQPEILHYLNYVADRTDIRRSFVFNTRVSDITYDDEDGGWTVRTEDSQVHRSKWVITAVGCLSHANVPNIEDIDAFAGLILHTGDWPHQPVDFSGQRVGIIGTGASGIQAIPVIAEQAEHLTVFQRTAQFTLPAVNYPVPPQLERMWKDNYAEWRRRGRLSFGGLPYPAAQRSALDVTAEERTAAFEKAWSKGAIVFALGTFSDLFVDDDANEMAADFVRAKIDEIVHDPAVAGMLKPHGYPFAAKRLPMDTNYYETFNRSNVTLVDLRATPVERCTPAGVETRVGHHDLDILIFATGFDALTGPLLAMDIRGRGGASLKEFWADGPSTYLGLAVPGFPNLFTITGPGSPSVLSNMPVSIEQHVEWITGCLEWLRQEDVDEIEAEAEATEEWTAHVQEAADRTIFPRAASWYTGANVPDKPRRFLPYVGGCYVYRQKCDEVAANRYEGFDVRSHRLAGRG